MFENDHSGEQVGLVPAGNPIVSTESHEIANASDTANSVTVDLGSGGESLPLVLQEILDEMRELTQALKALGPPGNYHGPETAERSVRAAGMNADQQQNSQIPEHEASENQDAGEGRDARDARERDDVSEVDSDRLKFQLEVRLLREPDEDVRHTHKAKHTFLQWLRAADRRLIWLNPDFLAEFQSRSSERIRGLFDTAWDRSHEEIVRNCSGRFTRKWAPFHALDASQSPIEESAFYRQTWACPPGRISWITDSFNSPLIQDLRDDEIPRKISAISIVTTLVQCFLIPNAGHELHQAFYTFIATFSDFFHANHPATVRSWLNISIDSKHREESFALQYHLRSFSPLESRNREALSRGRPLRDLFIRKRQVIWIGPEAESSGKEGSLEGYFVERALSISLIMYEPRGTFQIVVLRDETSHTGGYDLLDVPKGLQRVPGLWHFLNAMKRLLESWHQYWSSTLAVIDQAVGFTMDHAKDDHGLDKFMFDDAGPMKLSKRYFTVLQLLRIARQWIDENYTEWDKLCKDVDGYPCLWLRRVLGGDDEVLACWDDQRDNLTQLLETQTQQLRDRIDRKSEEVKSLRDGLFSATSLREATKGMDINRAIYVFTAVTVIYTPLGFVSALWALPILNTTTQGGNIHPYLPTFIATFVLVPVLTYAICGGLAWYYTSRNSKHFVQDTLNLARDLFRTIFSRKGAKKVPRSKFRGYPGQ